MRAFSFSCRGASHIKKGMVCQDFSVSEQNEHYLMAAVSDGHGSEDYFRSDRGSRFAAEAFAECVREAFTPISADDPETEDEGGYLENKSRNFAEAYAGCITPKQKDEQLRWFMRSIVSRWNAKVEEDIASEPFSEEEMTGISERARGYYEHGEKLQNAYGATLIGIVMTDGFWFGVHIGDGKCIAFDRDGKGCEPIPWDEQCFLNITTSICDSNALAECRSYPNDSDEDDPFADGRLPAAIFIGSDGIDDCFANDTRLHNFYRVILTSFASEDEDTALKELEEYLPSLSAQGSGDDMSVAGIIDIDYIREHPELFERIKIPYLRIMRMGDLGAPEKDDSYIQKKELEAAPGIIPLTYTGLGGFGKGIQEIEVLSAETDLVRVSIGGKEYEITPEQPAELTDRMLTLHGFEYDTLTVQMFMK